MGSARQPCSVFLTRGIRHPSPAGPDAEGQPRFCRCGRASCTTAPRTLSGGRLPPGLWNVKLDAA